MNKIQDGLAQDGAGSELSASDPLLHEALDWIVKLKTGEPTRRDIDDLQRWRAISPVHEAAFKRAAQIYRTVGSAVVRAEVASLNRRRLVRRVFLGGAIGAAATLLLIARQPLDAWPSLEALFAEYRTAKGEQRTIDLDGVSLELNTQTSVALRSGSDEDIIELITGEAAVVAARPAERPMVMAAAQGRIIADTAEFNIRCLGRAVTVTCLRGSITVAVDGSTASVMPGRQVSYDSHVLSPAIAIDPYSVLAWKSGLLVFKDQPLAPVVEEVNRYRSGRIIILNSALAGRLLNGTFQISRLEEFLPQVEQLLGVRAIELPGGIVFLS